LTSPIFCWIRPSTRFAWPSACSRGFPSTLPVACLTLPAMLLAVPSRWSCVLDFMSFEFPLLVARAAGAKVGESPRRSNGVLPYRTRRRWELVGRLPTGGRRQSSPAGFEDKAGFNGVIPVVAFAVRMVPIDNHAVGLRRITCKVSPTPGGLSPKGGPPRPASLSSIR